MRTGRGAALAALHVPGELGNQKLLFGVGEMIYAHSARGKTVQDEGGS